ncbi:DUF1942 domain-containing protein [Mycobacterium sp.]|uniref:MPT63 family protein n=1 Tax=Mycobacterium sp. TaxID=1785 RepID=UPI0025DD4513|nr:DUF1942 domain-containing protein [Mycobacterium sp.]
MNNSAFAAAIAAISTSAGVLYAAPAEADAAETQAATQHVLGGAAQVGDSTWTVSNLRPSSDTIPYHPAGTLWEATATDEASSGSTTPIVSNFNARAHSGQTYRELFQVASAQGVNPAGIAQGQKVSGKLYFDVTGDNPDSITYNAGGPDLALWVQPPPSAGSAGHGAHMTTPIGSPGTSPSAATAPIALPAGNPGGGSAGTVIPGAAPGPQSAGTGNPAGPPSAGTPATAPGVPAPAGAQPTPAPAAGSQGTPGGADVPAGAPAAGTPVPAAGTPGPGSAAGPTPVPAGTGSQGTPLQPGPDQAGVTPGGA